MSSFDYSSYIYTEYLEHTSTLIASFSSYTQSKKADKYCIFAETFFSLNPIAGMF